MFGVVWDYYSSKLKGKQYKQNTSPKSYKTEIKILANPGLALSGFEQPGPGYINYVKCLAVKQLYLERRADRNILTELRRAG